MSDRKPPTGYADEAAFLTEARERFQEGQDADRENRDEAKGDLKFAAGEQWDDADKEARDGLPCLTLNVLPQYVAQVVGDIRINRPSIKVRPAEDADKDKARIREGLIRAIQYDSGADGVYANAGQSQVSCGIGNFRAVLEHATAEAFDMQIRIKRIDNPFAVVWDPFITEPTGRDARYCFVSDDMPRKLFEATYPDQKADETALGTELTGDLSTNGWLSSDTVRVTEYWLVKERKGEIAQLQDGKVKEITKDNEAELAPQIATNSRGEPLRRKTTFKTVCMYLISGHAILEGPVEYKISRIPVFRVPGWEINLGGKIVRFGLVRFAKDPQRLKNYWRSVAAEKLALAPRQQWLIHENAEGDEDQFRNAAVSGDTVLKWRGAIPPQRMEPPQIEAALLQASEMNAQDIKDVTGLHDASLGARSNETSGKAILARQREGDVANFIYHDNLQAAICECGRVVNEWIPQVFDTARTIRVLGEDEQQTLQKINDPMDPEAIDLAVGKYDIVIETGPSYSTKRVEAAESMQQFIQAVPQAAAVAGDLFAKAQDWPLSEEIGERLKRAIPPQITADPKDPPPPPDPAMQAQMQEQQQAQQMAMAGAQLELRTKEAQARQAEANAMKAEADAMRAQAEAQIAISAPPPQPETQIDPRIANAQAETAQAKAVREHIAVESDALDLLAKPRKLAAEIDAAENPEPVNAYEGA